MKKPLLLLSAAALAAGTALAVGPQQTVTFSKSPVMAPSSSSLKVPAKAEGEDESVIVYTNAYEPSACYQLNNMPQRCTVYLAFEMTVADQQPYIGCDISAINVMAGVSNSDGNFPITKATVFVSEAKDAVPVNKTTGNISTTPYSITSIALEEPYTITGEKPIYIGYTLPYSSPCYFMPTDKVPTADGVNNLMVAVVNKISDAPQYANYSSQDPGSLCLSCNITGQNLPVNVVSLRGIDMPTVVTPGEKFSYSIQVKNAGINNITSLTVKSEYAGKSVESDITLPTALAPNETQTVTVSDLVNDEPGIYTLTSSIIKANGIAIDSPTSLNSSFESYSGAFPRRGVIEELTGTWCGWCPRGIVMMEYLKENYPDWIRIAVHFNDVMQVNDYGNVFSWQYSGGGQPGSYSAPYAISNRQVEIPVAGAVDSYYAPVYKEITGSPTYCNIELSATCSDDLKTADIKSTTTFVLNSDIEHRLSFVVVEDGVGPYKQTNNFAGGNAGAMGGWENKTSSALTVYDDVARACNSYPGIEGSLPAKITAGDYDYNTSVSIEKVKEGGAFRIVALITNAETGVIVNANEISLDKVSSVEGVIDDANNILISVENGNVVVNGANSVAVYTLDGRQMGTTGLPNGVYIVKADNVTRKIVVK